MAVTMAASEMVPFAKTGGLGDVTAALASALASRQVRVSAVLPAYRSILRDYILPGKAERIGFSTAKTTTATRAVITPITPSALPFFAVPSWR